MIEWGLTPDEFHNVELLTIMRILAQRQARNEGEAKSMKNQSTNAIINHDRLST